MASGSRRSAMRAEAAARLRSGDDVTTHVPALEQVEDGWVVRRVAGASGERNYRCPGCDQLHASGQPHVVAWPEGRPDDRRHWHTPCWAARHRRGSRDVRSPRYG